MYKVEAKDAKRSSSSPFSREILTIFDQSLSFDYIFDPIIDIETIFTMKRNLLISP